MKKLAFLISFILITLTCFPQLVRVVLKSRVSMVKIPYESVQIMNLRTGDKWVKIYPNTILSSSTVGIDNPIVENSSFEF